MIQFNKSTAGKIFLLAALYIVTGKIGLMLAAPPGYATLVWPPSGIALGMLIFHGWRLWPGILIGSFILNCHISQAIGLNLSVDLGKMAIALFIAAGSSIQALTAFFALKQVCGFPIALRNMQQAFIMVLIAGPISCVISASIGTATMVTAGLVQLPDLFSNWITWWMGDTIGVLVFLPLMMVSPGCSAKLSWKGEFLESLPVITLIVILLPMGITFYSWKAATEYIYQKNLSQFNSLALESEKALLHRFNAFGLALFGSRGFIASTDKITKDTWKEYISSLDVNKNYPGINGIGYIEYVPAEKLENFVESVRKSDNENFTVYPETEKNNFFIIRYIEPLVLNEEAVGLNIAFEKNRYAAAVSAMESGEIAITKNVVLVQDKNKIPGFLMLLPVYKSDMQTLTREQRKSALLGWVYMPLISKNFLHDLTVNQGKTILMRVFDGETTNTPVIYRDSQLSRTIKPMYSITKTIRVMQQDWTIVWSSTRNFEEAVSSSEPEIILCGGLVFTALFALFLAMLSYRTEFANNLVRNRTKELQENENRLNTILEMAPEGIITVNSDGVILSTNKAITSIFGYQEDELVGKTIDILFSDKNIANEFKYPSQKTTISTSGKRKDGSTVPLEIRMNQITLQDGTIQTVSTIEDTTELKKTESERTRLVSRLTESNTELERFAFVASHDLREPIRLVCSFTGLLSQEYANKLDDNAQKYIGIISMASRRMNNLVEDLLDYARIGNDSEKPEWFESQSVLEYVLEMLGVSIKESGAEITHGTMPYIISSRTRFMLVLQNLISNAIKYHREGVNPVIHVAAEEKENEWVFSVKDNGIGIKPEYRSQIFEPFKRLHSQSEFEGTGMGLAICRKIIDRKNGKFWVEESEDGGSIFYFTIPKLTPSI